jgi:hypothetical protein
MILPGSEETAAAAAVGLDFLKDNPPRESSRSFFRLESLLRELPLGSLAQQSFQEWPDLPHLRQSPFLRRLAITSESMPWVACWKLPEDDDPEGLVPRSRPGREDEVACFSCFSERLLS